MEDNIICEDCIYYMYDDEYDCYMCSLDRDEDEVQRTLFGKYKSCRYFRFGDDYTIVRKQN